MVTASQMMFVIASMHAKCTCHMYLQSCHVTALTVRAVASIFCTSCMTLRAFDTCSASILMCGASEHMCSASEQMCSALLYRNTCAAQMSMGTSRASASAHVLIIELQGAYAMHAIHADTRVCPQLQQAGTCVWPT